MPERYVPLSETFSTADAESPMLAFEQGTLRLRFLDWQEREVRLRFPETVAFRWEDGDAAVAAEHRNDASYRVEDSGWIRRLRESGTVGEADAVTHFKLCFNALGVLEVIAANLEVG